MNKEVVIANVKKNKFSIIWGVLALIAVVLYFYPLGGMQDDLRQEADDHAKNYGALTDIKGKKIFMPILNPDQTEAVPLPVAFPTPNVIKAGTEALEDLKNQSESLFKSVVQMNDHSVRVIKKGKQEVKVSGQLVQRLFKPVDESGSIPQRINFAHRYLQVLSHDPTATMNIPDQTALDDKDPNKYLVDPSSGEPAANLYNDVLHGGVPPTDMEISAAGAQLYITKYQPKILRQGGVAINEQAVNDKFREEAKSLKDRMKAEVARNKKMYVDLGAIDWSPDIGTESAPPFDSLWYAQMSLWLQQDLCDGLAKANEGRTNILDARVKRLLVMRVPQSPKSAADPFYLMPSPAEGQGGGGGGPAGGEGEKPSPATETQKITPSYGRTPTGRTSNGMYDVLQFQLVIDVDATQIKEVIKDLCDKKLISVTNLSVYNLDLISEKTKGFIYGNGAVARLVVDGEALYMRAWTADLMPIGVRERLGLSVAGGPGGPGGPRQGGPGMGGGGMGGGGMGGRGGFRQ